MFRVQIKKTKNQKSSVFFPKNNMNFIIPLRTPKMSTKKKGTRHPPVSSAMARRTNSPMSHIAIRSHTFESQKSSPVCRKITTENHVIRPGAFVTFVFPKDPAIFSSAATSPPLRHAVSAATKLSMPAAWNTKTSEGVVTMEKKTWKNSFTHVKTCKTMFFKQVFTCVYMFWNLSWFMMLQEKELRLKLAETSIRILKFPLKSTVSSKAPISQKTGWLIELPTFCSSLSSSSLASCIGCSGGCKRRVT